MSNVIIAKRYAKALFNISEEQGKTDVLKKDLIGLTECIKGSEELRNVFLDPQVTSSSKEEIVKNILGKLDASELSIQCLSYLLAKKRINILPEITDLFCEAYNVKENILDAEVTLASEMESKQIEEIKEKLSSVTGKTVQVKVKKDPSIIGGMVVKIGSKLIDQSVRNQLDCLKQSIVRA